MLTKSKSGSVSESTSEKITSNEGNVSQETKNVKITIKLEAYQHIEVESSISDIQTQCFYNLQYLGDTPLVPITDNGLLTVEHDFTFEINTKSMAELDTLISSPAILKIYVTPGVFDSDLYEQLVINPEFTPNKAKSIDSSISIYEALTESKHVEAVDEAKSKVKKLSKAKLKSDRSKKNVISEVPDKTQHSFHSVSKSSFSEIQAYVNNVHRISEKILFGQCIVDFLPLFYGEDGFKETLLVKKKEIYKDDRMTTYKNHPTIIISVSISEPLHLEDCMLMNFSIESIFNIPLYMTEEKDIQVCWVLPHSEDSFDEPIVLDSPILTTLKVERKFKFWPGFSKDDSCTTKYVQDVLTNDIKSKMNGIQTYFEDENLRLHFNVIKRNFFLTDGSRSIQETIKRYKNILLEIYVFSKLKKSISVEDKHIPRKPVLEYDPKTCSHLMAVVDLSELLYPGVRRTRVAAPVRTFCLEEAKTICGLEESYFRPNLNKPEITRLNDTKKENQDKEKKHMPSKGRRSVKTSELSALDEAGKNALTGESEKIDIPSSSPIYSSRGKPCFIVVELELSESLVKKRDLLDLSNRLGELLKDQPDHKPKIVLTPTLAKDYYTEILNEIILDMSEKFSRFLQENPNFKNKTDKTQLQFMLFLQKTGAYRLYLNSITRAISLIATTDARFLCFDDKGKISETFIGELFCYLVSKMHDTVNRMIYNGLEPVSKHVENLELLYVYAKEAIELGLTRTADRYLLERLSGHESNPDYWFDYAVFFLEQQDCERAFECVKNSLQKKPQHRYSLLLFGMLLDIKLLKDDAETAFLNLLSRESKWTEGWGVLYLFYQRHNNFISMDWALGMGRKSLKCNEIVKDYFSRVEDLAWSAKKYPNTVYFRTAIMLVKMRLLDWAENACAGELVQNTEFANEMLGVIFYYKKMYSHALKHLENCRYEKTADCSTVALYGHCLYKLGEKEAAKNEYEFITKSNECSENFSLVYHNCAKIMEEMNQSQEARKLMLLACKYRPTPCTWLIAGRLYYEQCDFLSAEECLSMGNSLDNRNGDIWGYLVLVNLKLLKVNEAELCYEQAVKCNVDDNENLYNEIMEERRKHELLN